MNTAVEPLLEESIEIDAPPVKVWALVSDLPRLAKWSPQVIKSFVQGGGPILLGTRLVNLNRDRFLFWPTRSKVVRFEPHREIAFRVKENKTIWSFSLEPTEAGGTRVVERREVPDGTSQLSDNLVDRAMGGQVKFQAGLRTGMRQTLERLKAEVEKS